MRAIYLETDCSRSNANFVDSQLEKSRPAKYEYLKKLIKRFDPLVYEALSLHLFNPYHEETAQNKEYYILVHSKIEYFFKKQ